MFPINNYVVYDLSKEYHHKRLREAEQSRLLQRLAPMRPNQWARGLSQLGGWLINCGAWLKRRYDPARTLQLHSNY